MNLSLLGPEIILGIVAVVIILLDLVVAKKGVLAAVGVYGVVVAALFNATLIGPTQQTFNNMLVSDSFSILFNFAFLGIAALVILSSVEYSRRFRRSQGEYYALILFSAAGMMLMASTRELISIYVALELTSISLYVLAAFLRDGKSTEAGLKYLLLGALSSAVLLYGMALLFGLTETTDLGKISDMIISLHGNNQPALILATVLLAAGFGFKIAMVPFQMWAPDVYEGAPTPITAFLSVGSKAAGFAVILRVFNIGFGSAYFFDWQMIFAVLSVLTMTFGNVVALVQSNIKRLLAYSSIAQAGYVLIGIVAASNSSRFAVSGVVFFLLGYALTNLGAFIAIIAISEKTGSDEIADFSGMAKRAPGLAMALAFCLISLTGIPPTVGFIGKFYLFSSAIEAGWIWLVVIGLVNSAISAYYYVKVVKVMYLGASASEEKIKLSAPILTALGIAILGVFVAGIYPGPLFQWVEAAAKSLIG
ncbi:MAG: NADH-quinone oxidoreductase subunit N [Dehalococcoidia bacterium]|nr:NADH-quinone oxidoreductase subunit N [Dehalococcoidia bacterium]